MAHHGIGRNPRLTRLMKKRSRVAPHSNPVITHHPVPTASDSGNGHGHGPGHEVVPVLEKRQDITSSDDLAKVWATVVNVIDDDSYTSSQPAGVTLASSAWLDGSVTAFPGYTSLTADTPSLTGSSQSMPSAAPSAYSSAMTSRPLINSSQQTPSSTSLTPTASPSATTSASLVTRSSMKTSSLSTSSTSSSFFSSFSSSTTPSTTSPDSSSYTGWFGGYGGGGGGGGSTQTGSGQNPTSTGTDPNQNSSGAPGPATTGKIVGGVVGSVAGAVMLVILALFLLKRRASMRKTQQALPSTEGAGAGGNTAGGGAGSAEMTSRPDSLLTATYFAPAFMKRWRQSTMTTNTDSTLVSSGSERGFQKISGRKIPSVLTYGGDGYGGGYDTGSPTISEPSMTTAVPGSPVNPRSPLTQPPPSTPFGMPLDVSYTREAEENDPGMYMRASPARTPVTSTASMISVSAPINFHRQSHTSLSPIPQRPDTLGRSHPSYDGSRGSRFTESL